MEKEIWEELERLKLEPVSLRELEKVKNNVTASQVNLMRSNEGLADRLAYFEMGKDWRMINTYLDDIKAVTQDDVQAMASRYFTEKNSTVGIVMSGKGGAL
jgi:zinc protease